MTVLLAALDRIPGSVEDLYRIACVERVFGDFEPAVVLRVGAVRPERVAVRARRVGFAFHRMRVIEVDGPAAAFHVDIQLMIVFRPLRIPQRRDRRSAQIELSAFREAVGDVEAQHLRAVFRDVAVAG